MSTKATLTNHEEILNLISLYRNETCLWNSNDEESKNSFARRQSLAKIAKSLNSTLYTVRNKIHYLRAQYRREQLRMIKLKTSRPKWLYYNALTFLGSINSKPSNSIEPLNDHDSIINDSNKISKFRERKSKNHSGHKDTSSNGVIVLSTEQQDEYDVFGENVANEMRSLENDQHLQSLLKCRILEAILYINKAAYDVTTVGCSRQFECREVP